MLPSNDHITAVLVVLQLHKHMLLREVCLSHSIYWLQLPPFWNCSWDRVERLHMLH